MTLADRTTAANEQLDQKRTTTVREVTNDLLRAYGLTTIFGNLGSTEQPFLANFRLTSDTFWSSRRPQRSRWPTASRKRCADRCSSTSTPEPASATDWVPLLTSFQNKTPLIVTAGQQRRDMALLEPYLTSVDPTMLPRPWVKWTYEPVRPRDMPAAFMRAIAIDLQPPTGPVFLSLPLDDWDQPCDGPAVVRTVGSRVAPDPARLREFADSIRRASSPVLIYGAAIARADGWKEAVALAGTLNAPVWAAPAAECTPFPEDRPLYRGVLAFAIGPLSERTARTRLCSRRRRSSVPVLPLGTALVPTCRTTPPAHLR